MAILAYNTNTKPVAIDPQGMTLEHPTNKLPGPVCFVQHNPVWSSNGIEISSEPK